MERSRSSDFRRIASTIEVIHCSEAGLSFVLFSKNVGLTDARISEENAASLAEEFR